MVPVLLGIAPFTPLMEQFTHILRGLIGVAAFLGLAILFSENRRAISWRIVGIGLLLQFVFAGLGVYG
jgi:nucleoside permease NupC